MGRNSAAGRAASDRRSNVLLPRAPSSVWEAQLSDHQTGCHQPQIDLFAAAAGDDLQMIDAPPADCC